MHSSRMRTAHLRIVRGGAGVVTMSQVGGEGGCCDHVPGGGGRGAGVVTMSEVGGGGGCCDHVPGGGGRGAGVVTMSQVGGRGVL